MMTPERLAEIRKYVNDFGNYIEEDLLAEVDQLRAQVEELEWKIDSDHLHANEIADIDWMDRS